VQGLFEALQKKGSESLLLGLNCAIEADPDLHAHMKSLAGKRLELRFPAIPSGEFSVHWSLAADGLLHDLSAGVSRASVEPVDVSLVLTPAFFSGAGMRGVRIEGDASVAEQLSPLMALMKSRVAPLQQAFEASPLPDIVKRAASYVSDEAQLVVNASQMAAHQQELRELRNAIDRFEKRLDLYAASH